MEGKKMNKQVLLAVVALGCMVAAVISLMSTGIDPSQLEEGAGESAVASAPSVSEPPQHVAPSPNHKADARPAPGTLRAIELPMKMPADLIEQVLQEDPNLALFMHYHRTVLLDEQGRQEYRKVLSDPRIMTELANVLRSPGQGEVLPKEHFRRLMATDYFEAALLWKDNPQRQKVAGLVHDIILEDNFSGGQDLDRQQMLAGGKMELYRLMYDNEMKQALDLGAQARGTRMEALVQWMAEQNLLWRAKEEQIRTEAQAMQASMK